MVTLIVPLKNLVDHRHNLLTFVSGKGITSYIVWSVIPLTPFFISYFVVLWYKKATVVGGDFFSSSTTTFFVVFVFSSWQKHSSFITRTGSRAENNVMTTERKSFPSEALAVTVKHNHFNPLIPGPSDLGYIRYSNMP